MSDQVTETTPLITAEEINRIVSARKVEIVNAVLNSIVNDAKASMSAITSRT